MRKRVKLKELVLFETTVVTHRPAPSFSYAVQLGAQQISEDKEEAFELAVDIRRARLQRIKPLASAEARTAAEAVDPPPTLEPVFDEAPDLPDDDAFTEPDPATLNPKDRLARWQRKLLDLSLRNNLLNFRSGRKALKLEAPDAGAVEDLLSDGQALKLLPRPDLMDGADPRNQAIYEGREPLIEMLRRDFRLNLGVADGELLRDDAGLDVAAIWKSVSNAIKDIKGWEVTEDVVLTMFSFAKHLRARG